MLCLSAAVATNHQNIPTAQSTTSTHSTKYPQHRVPLAVDALLAALYTKSTATNAITLQ